VEMKKVLTAINKTDASWSDQVVATALAFLILRLIYDQSKSSVVGFIVGKSLRFLQQQQALPKETNVSQIFLATASSNFAPWKS